MLLLLGICQFIAATPASYSRPPEWLKHLQARPDPERCNRTLGFPAVAICIAGAARTFATPLLFEHHYHNFVRQLVPDHAARQGSRVFVYLKTADSGKVFNPSELTGLLKHATNMPAENTEAEPIFAALETGWLRRLLAEAVIINGSGSYVGEGWLAGEPGGPEAAIRQGNESLEEAIRPKAHKCKAAETDLKLRPAAPIALSAAWCGAAIARHEHRVQRNFNFVAFARPDLLFQVPVPPLCTWPYIDKVLACTFMGGSDGFWAAPRQYADQLFGVISDFSKCHDASPRYQCAKPHDPSTPMLSGCSQKAGSGSIPSCCGPGEFLLIQGLMHPTKLPVNPLGCSGPLRKYLNVNIRSSVVQDGALQGKHTCEMAMSPFYALKSVKAYANRWISLYRSAGRLSPNAAEAIRHIFGLQGNHSESDCRASLMPLSKAHGEAIK